MSKPISNPGRLTKGETATALSFLAALKGPITLVAIHPDDGRCHGRTFTRDEGRDAVAKWIDDRQGKFNIYYSVNPVRQRINKKPTKEDMGACRFYYVDCDPKDDESTADAKKRHIAKLNSGVVPPPTFTYDSGNGIAALWALKEPRKLNSEDDIAEHEAISAGLAQALGGKAEGYDHCQNIDRILRLPGTLNLPNAKKRAAGRVVALAGNVKHFPERTYSEFDFDFPAPSIVPDAKPTDIEDVVTTDDLKSLNVPDRIKQIIEHGRVPGEVKEPDDSRSAWEAEAVCAMLRDGIEREVILGLLLDERYEISERILEKGDNAEEYARKSIARLQAHVGKDDNPADDFADDDDEPAKIKRRERFKGMSLSELRNLPPLEYLLAGIIPVNSLFELYGPPKAGKTFFVLGLGMAIATGTDFCALKVRPGRVLHVLAEGNRTSMLKRVEGWLKEQPKEQRAKLEADIQENWRMVGVPVHMDVAEVVKEFLAANPGKWDLIVVDTLLRNMAGHVSDPKDMAAFIAGCDRIREATGAAVVAVHHEGKDKARGGMGSMVLDAGVDGVLYFFRDRSHQVMRIVILRDGSDDQPDFLFKLVTVILSADLKSGTEEETAFLEFTERRRKGDNDEDQDDPEDELLLRIYREKPARQTDLVSGEVSRSTVSRRVKDLQALGYIEEGSTLKLTKQGAERVKELEE